jgi:23S rRNA pseudouridine2605 synthase
MERIEKYLVRQGVDSRQEAKRLLRQKRVLLNGELVTKAGILVDPQKDNVIVDDNELKNIPKELFLLLNKPTGYITSSKLEGERNIVYELLPADLAISVHPVGRLDSDSEGLLLFVSDGNLTHRLTHPKYHVEKEYEVVIEENGNVFTDEIKEQLETGVKIDGELTRPCKLSKVKVLDNKTMSLNIVLTEGKHRQIRRMFAGFGMVVTNLKRIRIGELKLGPLAEGETRILSATEIEYLKDL